MACPCIDISNADLFANKVIMTTEGFHVIVQFNAFSKHTLEERLLMESRIFSTDSTRNTLQILISPLIRPTIDIWWYFTITTFQLHLDDVSSFIPIWILTRINWLLFFVNSPFASQYNGSSTWFFNSKSPGITTELALVYFLDYTPMIRHIFEWTMSG